MARSVLVVSCLMVILGVAVLAGVDWQLMKLGRGEWETLLGSLLFTGQIFSAGTAMFCADIM